MLPAAATVAWLRLLQAKAGVATHPEDDLILSAAASANADYLVTGDAGLLGLTVFRETQIVSPRAFLDILSLQTP